jgi:NADH:ubiquinone oxidoreductase subunit K
MFEGVPLTWFLIVATLMFFIGIYGFLVRKNLITMLMSLELILNSVNINFVAFNKLALSAAPGRDVLSRYFIIAVAAAEASVAIAIIINIYRRLVNIDVEKME